MSIINVHHELALANAELSALRARVEELTRERDAAISAEMAWQEGAQHVLQERKKIAEIAGFDPTKLFLDYGMSDVERAIRHRVREASECKAFATRAETAESINAELAAVAKAAEDVAKRMRRIIRDDECDCLTHHVCAKEVATHEVQRFDAALAALSPAARAKIGGTE